MKPRNEHEREVVRLSSRIPQDKLTDGQLKWLVKVKYGEKAQVFRGKFWCPNCGKYVGEVGENDLLNSREIVCPHCRSKLETETADTNFVPYQIKSRRIANGCDFVLFCQKVEGYQVMRYFSVRWESKLLKGIKSFSIQEVVRTWSKKGSPLVTESVGYGGIGCWYWDSPFSRYADLKLKGKEYHVNPLEVYPRSSFTDEYRRFGLNNVKKLYDHYPLYKLHTALENDHALTICEAGWYALMGKYLNLVDEHDRDNLWTAVKIAIRNGYDNAEKRIDVWYDYVKMLGKLGLDLHNAHYVCPDDLVAAHDNILKRLRKKEEQQMLKEMSEQNSAYRERVARFLGLKFKCGALDIAVLPSIYDFKYDGDVLQHCVYHGAYYNKQNSLVLSARKDGVPVETIELSLQSFKILQCHGFRNKSSEYHDRILGSVKAHIPKIRELAKNNISTNNIRANIC